jgi:hypothetical protein
MPIKSKEEYRKPQRPDELVYLVGESLAGCIFGKMVLTEGEEIFFIGILANYQIKLEN